MRWLILAYEHDPRVKGDMGGYRKVWELAERLSKRGEEVLIVSPVLCAPVRETVGVAPVPFIDVPVLRPLTVYLGLLIRSLLLSLRRSVDIIYTRNLHVPLAPLLARLLRAKLVAEVNGDSYALHQNLEQSRLRLVSLRLADRFVYRSCDHIIPITSGLRDMLHDRYGVEDDRMTVIESGTDLDLFRPADAEATRRRLGLKTAEGQVVGFAGTFYAYQGLSTLIRAAGLILSREPTTRFLIVGDGVMRESWETEAKERGVAPAFLFTGQVPYHRVADYMNAMDICVCPWQATRGETSPLKLFDYMACGRPVVVSDIPSVRDTAVRSGAATLVPPDDAQALAEAILLLIRNPALRQAMGEQGRRFVEAEHGWDRQAEQVLAVGRRVCGRAG